MFQDWVSMGDILIILAITSMLSVFYILSILVVGVVAERDIVQFVPYLEFTTKRPGDNMMSVKARLAKEVLAEIPDQFLSYMKARGMFTSIVLEE